MHMADALVSPPVGGAMWAVSAGLIAFCARKVKQTLRNDLVPMMGVLGAFIFAAQMINFSIPGTGSSGHLGGGLILTVLLGPHAAFLVIASVLTVQAFFFADGGLLALGCNIFNLGFFPAFVAYPFIYRIMAGRNHAAPRAWMASVLAAIAGLLFGALGVVMETTASGISELPFRTFCILMLPIHLAIGVVEGLATAAVVSFVARARPEALPDSSAPANSKPVLAGLAIAAILMGGIASWFASTQPDGLEWSIAQVTGKEEVGGAESGLHHRMAELQERTALLPDYELKPGDEEPATADETGAEPESWPAVNAGTSISGIVGGFMTLMLACLIGFVLKARSWKRVAPGQENRVHSGLG